MRFYYCLLLASLFFCNNPIKAQDIDWQNSYGGSGNDVPNSIYPTADGGYIIAGYSNSPDGDITNNKGGNDYWIIKINSLGTLQWEISLGGSSNHDYATSIIQNPAGEYVVAGNSFSRDGDIKEKKNKGGDDAWIVILTENGKIKKHNNLGGFKRDMANAIDNTTDGGYIMAGYTESNEQDVKGNHGKSDMWIVKLKPNGKKKWQKTLGGSETDIAYDVKQTSDGGYIVVGETNSVDGNISSKQGSYDFWVLKLTEKGRMMWQKCLGGSGDDVAKSVIETDDGGFLIAGETNSRDGHVKGNNGAFDIWLVKLSERGAIQWTKTYGGSSFDFANHLSNDAFGGYVVVGGTNTLDPSLDPEEYGSTNAFVLKLEYNGNLKWQKTFGGNNVDEARSVTVTDDGSFMLACQSASVNGDIPEGQAKGGDDFWIVKMADYNVAYTPETRAVTFKTEKVANDITQTSDDGYIAVGYVDDRGNKDILINKYDVNGALSWTRRISGEGTDVANAVVQTSDGFLIAGESDSQDSLFAENQGDYDCVLLKLDKEGKLKWLKMLGGNATDKATYINKTKDGNYIMTAGARSNNGDIEHNKGMLDYWVVKLNAAGRIIWQYTYGGTDIDIPYKVIETVNGNYLVVGYTQSTNGDIKENRGVSDAWVIEIDKEGRLLWQQTFGGSSSDKANDVVQVDDTHYVLVGTTKSTNDRISKIHGGSDIWVAEIDLFGEVIWEENYGGSNNDEGNNIVLASDGGLVIAGNTSSNNKDVLTNNGKQDGWVFKLDRKGKIQWQSNYGDIYNDGFNGMAVIAENLYILAGFLQTDKSSTILMLEEIIDGE